MVSPETGEPARAVGAQIICNGRSASRVARDYGDEESPDEVGWETMRMQSEIPEKARGKGRFMVGASIFLIGYCLAVTALWNYARPLMAQRVGPLNVGYIFALSQFFIAWIVAALYVRTANIFDRGDEPRK